MARDAKGITFPIVYKSDLSGLKSAEGGLAKFGKMAAGIGAAAVGAVTGIAIAGIKSFADFDSKLNQSVAIMGDVSDAMREDMANAARDVAKATTFSAGEAAESYFFLASAGLDAEASIAALPTVANFAQAGMFDMAQATDLLTDAQSALGLSSDDAAENLENMSGLADVLVKANTLANASVEQFSSALTNKAAASMRTLNMDMEEGVAVLAVFADQGLKGEAAGTAFSATMNGLTKNARDNASAFEALGVEVFDSTGELNSMSDIVGQLEDGLDGMSTEQVDATLASLGLTKQSLDGTKALLGNSEALREYEDELRNAGGTVDEVAGKQLDTLEGQLALLESAFADIGLEVGKVLVPVIMDLVKELGPLVEELGPVITEVFTELAPVFADIAKEIPGLVQGLMPLIPVIGQIASIFFELLAAVLPPFVDLINKLSPIIEELAPILAEAFITILEAAVPIFFALIDALMPIIQALLPPLVDLLVMLAPVILALLDAFLPLIEAVLPVLVGLLEMLIPWWVFLAEVLSGIVAAAVEIVIGIVESVIGFFTNFGDAASSLWKRLSSAFQSILNFFRNFWTTTINAFSTGINNIVTFFRNLPTLVLNVLRGAGTWLVNTGRDILQGLRNGIDTIWNNLSTWFRSFPTMIRNMLSGAASWLSGIGRQVIDGFLDGLKGAWKAVTDWIGGAAESVSGVFKNILGIKSPSKVFMEHGEMIGKGLQIGLEGAQPKVMQEVSGLVNVARVEGDIMGSRPSGGLVSSGGSNITVIVNAGMGTDGAEVGRKVVESIKAYERRSGKVFVAA